MWLHASLTVLTLLALPACAAMPVHTSESVLQNVLAQPPQVLLLGEQHDAPTHPGLHANMVQGLVTQGQLAALVLEMADRGQDTRRVPQGARDRKSVV